MTVSELAAAMNALVAAGYGDGRVLRWDDRECRYSDVAGVDPDASVLYMESDEDTGEVDYSVQQTPGSTQIAAAVLVDD